MFVDFDWFRLSSSSDCHDPFQVSTQTNHTWRSSVKQRYRKHRLYFVYDGC